MSNRKGRLGANFYQLLVVDICRNTYKSHDKTLQLLQNHSVSHHTDSQRSLISFLWFWVICGSIAIVGFQQSHNVDKISEVFFTFSSLELKATDNKTLRAQTWLVIIKLLPYTVLLNLKIVCHLAELNSIKNYSKTIDFSILFLLLWITTNKIVLIGAWNINVPIIYTLQPSTPHILLLSWHQETQHL